jgi:predicted esterase
MVERAPAPKSVEARAVTFAATGFYRLDVPTDLPPGPAACVLALHGYGQPPEEMATYARLVAPPHAVVLAPEGPLSFYREPRGAGGPAAGGVGFAWIADPRREEADARNTQLIEAAWAHANAEHPLDPRRTALLGFSQGVGVGMHWLLEHPARAAAVVALAGGVREPLRPRLSTLRGLSALWITGRRDHAYVSGYMDALLPALTKAGLDVERLDLPGGHAVLVPAADHVRTWLAARLPSPT